MKGEPMKCAGCGVPIFDKGEEYCTEQCEYSRVQYPED